MPATGSGSSPPTGAENPRCCAASPARWRRARARSPRSRGLTVGYVEQNVPEALMDTPFYAAVLRRSPPITATAKAGGSMWRWNRSRCPRRCGSRPLKQLSGGWQRLAMLARVLVTRGRRAAARRADQPSRPRPGSPAGKLAERAAARHARRHLQPRPRLSRCDHEPDAVPAAGAVAAVFVALYTGARRARRGRRFGRAALSARHEDRPAAAPAGGEAQQYRHQFRQRPAVVEDQAAEAAGREAGGCGKAGASRTIRRRDQACQSRHPCQGAGDAGRRRGRRRRMAGCCFGPASSSSARATASCCSA